VVLLVEIGSGNAHAHYFPARFSDREAGFALTFLLSIPNRQIRECKALKRFTVAGFQPFSSSGAKYTRSQDLDG